MKEDYILKQQGYSLRRLQKIKMSALYLFMVVLSGHIFELWFVILIPSNSYD